MNLLNWLVFFGILIGIYYVARLRNKVLSNEAYLVASRKTTLFPLVATLVMTELNTSTLLGFSSMGYVAGFWAMSLASVFLIGLLFYAAVAAKKWKQYNGLSVSTFFSERYSKNVGFLVAAILFIAMLGFSANYIKSLTLIFSALLPHISPWILSALLASMMLFIIMRGGLLSIIRFDSISFILVLIFFPIWALYAAHMPYQHHVVISFSKARQLLSPHFVLSLIILTMFTYILAPWYGQKIFAANKPRTALIAMVFTACFVFLFYGLSIFSASELKRHGVTLAQPQLAIPYLLKNVLPQSLQGLNYALLFFISATTLTGLWNAMVAMLVGHFHKRANTSSRRLSIYLTLLCAVISYLLSNTLIDQILNKLILMNIPIAALAFSLLAGFYWKRATEAAAFVSIVTGIVGASFCYFYFGEGIYTWYWAVYVTPASFIAGALTVFLRKRLAASQKKFI